MPRYSSIRFWSDAVARERTLDRLLALRAQLRAELLGHKTPDSLLLATWNIRDFDSNKFRHGPRLAESFHYIAEIIAAFDLVAVQEVNRDLSALERVMSLLGPDWSYIATDTTEGSGGNQERMAFVYDRRKVRFRGIAGEIVLPEGQTIAARKKTAGGAEEIDRLQFARTPFMVAFQAGWFKFDLCTVHIYYGADSGAQLERRIEEIRRIARFLARRQKKEVEDYILLGDFNIVSPQHQTMQALEAEGFVVPEPLTREGSNLDGDKHYDQIALCVKEKRLEIGASGVFRYTSSVFRDTDEDYAAYFDRMPPDKRDFERGEPRTDAGKRAYYALDWRTWQMSDHLPMWLQLKVDFTDQYLESLKPGEVPLADLTQRAREPRDG
ncbi:MAG: endonuclease/exonuclease/phosphatase family protein [Geminicoccaceae bacterium]